MSIKLVILLTCMVSVNGQKLILHNLQGVPISVTNLGRGRIQSGTVKMIHPINLTSIEETVESLLSIAKPEVALDTQLSYTLEVKIDELKRAFNSLKPKAPSSRRARIKRWDQLGKVWKWIAGSPDADDLRTLNKTINELVTENNAQVKINLAINDKLDQAIDMINSMMYIHKSHLEREQLDISVVNMIMTIDTLKRHIDEIHEAITKARIHLIHQPLVTEEELSNIVETLMEEGIEVNVESEALQYVEAKVVTNEETLLYIINTPKLLETKYDVVRVIPLINNNEKLKLPGEFFLTSSSETQFIHSNIPLKAVYQLDEIINVTSDSCIHNIIQGRHGSCQFQTVLQWDHVVKISSSMVLINNATVRMDNTCGVYNHTLTGHYLISFSNCSVTIDGHRFSNAVLTSKESPLFPPIHTQAINRSLSPAEYNVRELSKLHLETRHQLAHLMASHEDTRWTMWSSTGGLSTSVMVAFVLLVALFWKYHIIDRQFRETREKATHNPDSLSIRSGEMWDNSVKANTVQIIANDIANCRVSS